MSKIVQKHAEIYSSIIGLLFPWIILWLSRPNVVFSLLLRAIWFLPNDASQLKILCGYREGKYCQYSSQRSLCYEAKKRRSQWISCKDVGWIPDFIRCGTLTSKFDSFDLILFARCKQSGSRVCNKWMVLQDCFLFLPLCLSSYDWIKIIGFLVSHRFRYMWSKISTHVWLAFKGQNCYAGVTRQVLFCER